MFDKKLKILIVDDDVDSRYLADKNIRQNIPEVEIVQAASAKEALDLQNLSEFDVIVTDYRMCGGMNGVDFSLLVRNRDLTMPIILKTAMENIPGTKLAGVTHVLPWFQWRELGKVILGLLPMAKPASI